MRYVNELFDSVQARLLRFCTLLTQATDEIEMLRRTTESSVSASETDMNEMLKKNAEYIEDVTAFYNIAKGHSNTRLEKLQPIPYDKKRLLQLNVQINTSNKNDPFAAQLLVEAGGQLLYLETKNSEITEHFRNIRQSFVDSFNQSQNRFLLNVKSIREECLNYVNSSEYQSFVTALCNEYYIFNSHNAENSQFVLQKNKIGIGVVRAHLPTPDGCGGYIEKASRGFYNSKDGTVALPISVAINAGSCLFVEYNNRFETSVLSGIQNFLANIATYYGNTYRQILFIDPIRYNNSSLGILSRLAGDKDALFDNVPNSDFEISKKLESLIKEITLFEKQGKTVNGNGLGKIIVLHNFPLGYDTVSVKRIQQICVNAARLGILIIITHNPSERTYGTLETVDYIKCHSMCIYSNDEGFRISNSFGQDNLVFLWYLMPNQLPAQLVDKYIDNRPVVDYGNDFEKRIGLSMHSKPKGTRVLSDIPYGIDENGKMLSLSFEQENFATFICGAAGSGKTTLLHTIITGLIENNHPDDIELWLIDYKMVEFSRYVAHRPPHIRYIILDKSPELVYDIIDRLTEIVLKRQNIFKGRWNEHKDVPPDKYMPAIMVIIDEFPEMSQAIADSINFTENYVEKLDLLLSKGRGLGIHFIFASQNYTNGVKGLSNFAKMQIQQRIAMKIERNEIREALSLPSPTEMETAMMERVSITKYYALTRLIPNDNNYMLENRLVLSKVINIADKNKHMLFLDSLSSFFSPMSRYDVSDNKAYIDKQTLVLDGNIFLAFCKESADMLKQYEQENVDEDDVLLFVGQPVRMKRFVPVTLSRSFGENILIISPQKENMPTLSVLLSIEKSLRMKDKDVEIWSSKKALLFKQFNSLPNKSDFFIFSGSDDVCQRLHDIKNQINNGEEVNKCVCIIGFGSIAAEVNFLHPTTSDTSGNKTSGNNSPLKIAKREEGAMDFLSMMRTGAPVEAETEALDVVAKEGVDKETDILYANSFEVYEDLKFILSNGPRYGCNIIMVFHSLGEYTQCKIDNNLFRHRMLFKIPRSDSMLIVGSRISKLVDELADHSFRYSDGVTTSAYRPYLHEGVAWDGWRIVDGNAIHEVTDESEYLL